MKGGGKYEELMKTTVLCICMLATVSAALANTSTLGSESGPKQGRSSVDNTSSSLAWVTIRGERRMTTDPDTGSPAPECRGTDGTCLRYRIVNQNKMGGSGEAEMFENERIVEKWIFDGIKVTTSGNDTKVILYGGKKL